MQCGGKTADGDALGMSAFDKILNHAGKAKAR